MSGPYQVRELSGLIAEVFKRAISRLGVEADGLDAECVLDTARHEVDLALSGFHAGPYRFVRIGWADEDATNGAALGDFPERLELELDNGIGPSLRSKSVTHVPVFVPAEGPGWARIVDRVGKMRVTPIEEAVELLTKLREEAAVDDSGICPRVVSVVDDCLETLKASSRLTVSENLEDLSAAISAMEVALLSAGQPGERRSEMSLADRIRAVASELSDLLGGAPEVAEQPGDAASYEEGVYFFPTVGPILFAPLDRLIEKARAELSDDIVVDLQSFDETVEGMLSAAPADRAELIADFLSDYVGNWRTACAASRMVNRLTDRVAIGLVAAASERGLASDAPEGRHVFKIGGVEMSSATASIVLGAE